MNIVFVEPAFPNNQRQFVRALASIGVNVYGVGECPYHHLDGELKGWLVDYIQIGSVVDEAALLWAVRICQGKAWIDRLEATVEAHILPAARVREAAAIPGTTVQTAYLCRDKPAMKETLRRAGIPCAQSTRAERPQDARDFAAAVGYPIIAKPPDGAGAAGTTRIADDLTLERVIRESRLADGVPLALEEFIEGHEGYLDTLTVDGQVTHEYITHYYPNVLNAMRERWISPQMVTTNRMDAPGYGELRLMAREVNRILGIGTSATHMEWFYGPKGLRFSEIGCRPPGVCQWDVYCATNELDLYREWALALAHGRTEGRPSRRFAGGMIALRPDRDGHITGYSGTAAIWERHGQWIVADHFPPPGTPTQPVAAGYMANAWLRMRHPDFDELRAILDDVGRTIQVHAA